MITKLKYLIYIILIILISGMDTSAQVIEDETLIQYFDGFPFQEGIYTSYSDFVDNNPKITSTFEKRGSQLYLYNDSLKDFEKVNPERVWGYSQAGNVYISQEGAYWRIINMGALAQFSAIVITTVQSVDNFGFPITQRSKSMQQLFLDFNSGEIYELNAKNLKPYFEKDPILKERFSKLKKREKDLILALKAYNELYPIYLPLP